MRTVPWHHAAILAAAFTAGLPTISSADTLRATLSLACMCWQPEKDGEPPTPSPGDSTTPAGSPAPASADGPPVGDQPPSLSPGDQREARILMTNGNSFTGLLVEHNKELVVLKISGIPTPFFVKDIARVETLLPNRERYEQLKGALDPKDVRSRLNLAQWLFSVEMFPEALDEVTQALKLDPQEQKAADLKLIIEQQIRLRERGRKPKDADPAKPAEPKVKLPPFPTLNPDQINTIRVYEVNLADPPRMSVARDVVTKLMEQYAGDPLVPVSREGRDALYRKRPEQILELMFKLRARDFYTQVKVLQDPESMRKFRDEVHRGWLMNSCATSDCHGGSEAGRLMLSNRLPNSDATVYTNFLILDRFRIRTVKGDRKGDLVPLIDYANPKNSPLLQLGLPPEESLYPHPTPNRPGKATFRPMFRSEEDGRYQRAVEWIQSMYLPRPDYRIDYTPPVPPKPVAQQPAGEKPAEAPDEPKPGR